MPGVDVLDEHRPRRGPVALPQLGAVAAVVALKKSVPSTFVRLEGAANHPPPGLISLTSTVPAAVPVAPPQLQPVAAVVGPERRASR